MRLEAVVAPFAQALAQELGVGGRLGVLGRLRDRGEALLRVGPDVARKRPAKRRAPSFQFRVLAGPAA